LNALGVPEEREVEKCFSWRRKSFFLTVAVHGHRSLAGWWCIDFWKKEVIDYLVTLRVTGLQRRKQNATVKCSDMHRLNFTAAS